MRVRQIDELFSVVALQSLWDQGCVRNQIVEVFTTHRAGIAEIVDLNRCRSHGEDAWPVVLHTSFEVHRDVDLKLSRELRDLHIWKTADLDEPIECLL